MTTNKRPLTPALVLTAALLLTMGFAGGLVLSGRLSLTSPASAVPLPDQARATRPSAALPTTAALPDLSAVAETALKASANITSTTVTRMPDNPWFQFMYGDQAQSSESLGSGVVVSPDGYVLTNTHVIGNAGAQIRVTLWNGREQPAKLIGLDSVSDLAVIKVNAQNQPTLPWGDSEKLRVAQWVLAIGNPFQLSGTVTLGIVSTVSRSGAQVGGYANFIQTDAAINPGNSGGALVNARGELVGINSMIYSRTGGYQGIGFAIPSNEARQIMKELIENPNHVISCGSIGEITWVNVDRPTAEEYNLTTTGALVRSIARSSSAYRAGVEPGDIVVAVNGEKVTTGDEIDRLVVAQKVGSILKISLVRQNGTKETINVPVMARQDQGSSLR